MPAPNWWIRRTGCDRPDRGKSAAPSSHPKLVLLRAVQDGQAADIEDGDGAHYTRVGVIEPPEPPVSPTQTDAELAAYRRQQARRRCTFVLRLLAGVAITTGILGVLPAFRLAWIFTGITGIAALALAGLIAYAREVEGQRRQSRSGPSNYGVGRARSSTRTEAAVFSGAAQAGFPGAWDEDEDIEYDDVPAPTSPAPPGADHSLATSAEPWLVNPDLIG